MTAQERRAGSGMRAMLEGPVREAAVVTVNGKPAGSVWCAPYEVEVSGLLHAGENTIRVVVANLAINEMAKGPLPDYKALNAKYGDRFQDQDTRELTAAAFGAVGPGAADREVNIMKMTRRNALGILASTVSTAALEQDAAAQTSQ